MKWYGMLKVVSEQKSKRKASEIITLTQNIKDKCRFDIKKKTEMVYSKDLHKIRKLQKCGARIVLEFKVALA
jgi:hypothetical protein